MKKTRGCWLVCVLFLAAMFAGCSLKAARLRNKGIAEFQVGRPDEARKLLKEALDVKPSDAEALYYMGRAMQRDGFYDQAIFYYHSCLQAEPGHVGAQEWLGKAMTASNSAGAVLGTDVPPRPSGAAPKE